jgi:rhamnogalacturonyl hydrolase YesR
VGAQLYRLTGNPEYLIWAKRMYEWVRRCLLLPSGLYADSIGFTGKVDPTVWSYNQGSMIGAGVLLYQATGEDHYLSDAQSTAAIALGHWGLRQLLSESPFFVAVFSRNLLYLNSVRPNPAYTAIVRQYADYIWTKVRDPRTGLFPLGPGHTVQLLDQAAALQIFALLGSSPGTYF